jgi:hypothetical protein
LSRGTLEHVTSPRRARSLLGSSDLLRTLYACQRAPSRTFRRPARVSACGCPDLPSSGLFGSRIHVPLESIPSRVFTSPGRPTLSGRMPTPTRFPAPTTASPGLAPMRRVVPPPSRSALGFSQPLSGSPAHPGFAALSHAAAIPGVLPSGAFLLVGVAYPSRGRLCSLAVVDRRQARRGHARPCAPGFTDAHAVRRGCLDPRQSFRRRFSRPRVATLTTSPAPWTERAADLPRRRLRPLRSLLPPTKPYRAAAEAATRPLLPWACAPPEPSSDRASDPVTRWTIPSTAG